MIEQDTIDITQAVIVNKPPTSPSNIIILIYNNIHNTPHSMKNYLYSSFMTPIMTASIPSFYLF